MKLQKYNDIYLVFIAILVILTLFPLSIYIVIASIVFGIGAILSVHTIITQLTETALGEEKITEMHKKINEAQIKRIEKLKKQQPQEVAQRLRKSLNYKLTEVVNRKEIITNKIEKLKQRSKETYFNKEIENEITDLRILETFFIDWEKWINYLWVTYLKAFETYTPEYKLNWWEKQIENQDKNEYKIEVNE